MHLSQVSSWKSSRYPSRNSAGNETFLPEFVQPCSRISFRDCRGILQKFLPINSGIFQKFFTEISKMLSGILLGILGYFYKFSQRFLLEFSLWFFSKILIRFFPIFFQTFLPDFILEILSRTFFFKDSLSRNPCQNYSSNYFRKFPKDCTKIFLGISSGFFTVVRRFREFVKWILQELHWRCWSYSRNLSRRFKWFVPEHFQIFFPKFISPESFWKSSRCSLRDFSRNS